MSAETFPAEAGVLAARARGALERVCSGREPGEAARYYSPSFVDHVNDLEFRGLEGVRRSVDLYRTVLADLEVRVEEQMVQGDRVTSCFVVTGRKGSRRVRFRGITVSRFEDGLIAEDWSVIDSLGLVRQLGPLAWIRLALRTGRRSRSGQGRPRLRIRKKTGSREAERTV
jgi:predicted ester cyclase